jgi:hypothetical protein
MSAMSLVPHPLHGACPSPERNDFTKELAAQAHYFGK